jgi:hypothetical protein
MMFMDNLCASCPKKADSAELGDCVVVLDEYDNLIQMIGIKSSIKMES